MSMLHVCLTGWLLTLIYVFMCMVSWMIRPPCEITDQLAVGTQAAFRLCFTRLMLTLKQAPRMHRNAPLPDKKIEKFLGRGHDPLPRPLPTVEGGYPIPRPHPLGASGASISRLRRSAFSFLFIYDSNTANDRLRRRRCTVYDGQFIANAFAGPRTVCTSQSETGNLRKNEKTGNWKKCTRWSKMTDSNTMHYFLFFIRIYFINENWSG